MQKDWLVDCKMTDPDCTMVDDIQCTLMESSSHYLPEIKGKEISA